MANQEEFRFVRLCDVIGRDGLRNDIFFSSFGVAPSVNIVFFGGDVQNEMAVMSKIPDGSHFAQRWCYESMTRRALFSQLDEDIGGIHLWIVHASRWLNDIFACYDNFTRCQENGVPDFSGLHGVRGDTGCCAAPIPKAWLHLNALIENAVQRVEGASTGLPCAVIGFSKGASVVTQLLYEFAFWNSSDTRLTPSLMRQVCSLTWLDAGHNGQTHLWPTWQAALSRLSLISTHNLPLILAFATPYELNDKNRPWNRRDFKSFINLLKTLQIPHVSDTFFRGKHWEYSNTDCEPQNVNLETHFEILSTFPLKKCLPPCL